ncbi:aminoglycoside adenylyltransferase domain-containing protein, partial [Candidatus Eisenbacteria bacterium]
RLPNQIHDVTKAFVDEAASILGAKLYGIYMYGASVFDDGGPIQDIDCHVILNGPLGKDEREALLNVHKELAERYPPLGGELDAYFILLDAAKASAPPQHQLDLTTFDNSWALHCAHVRGGRYVILWGPEPTEVFPAPSWGEIATALEDELAYVKGHLCHPAYCVLNLCRIAFSYSEKDPVKSKHGSGLWASERFPEWKPLIQVAMRVYEKEHSEEDGRLLGKQLNSFLMFVEEYLDRIQEEDTPNQTMHRTPLSRRP